jgi:hypothetical protein
MTAQEIAAALGTHSVKAGGGYMGRCPAHNDRNPSLAIDDKDGALLVKCFAGCEQGAVVDALKARNLWPGNADTLPPTRKPVTEPIWKHVLPVPTDAPEPPAAHHRHGKPSHVWRYLSATGDLLQIICRFDTADGKQVLPLIYASNGNRKEWRFQAISDKRPLYGLELIGSATHILIVEGEKATDAARRLIGEGLPVVTWTGGSNATSRTDFSPLAGKTVAIWPDADEAGKKAALAVADHLAEIGCSVKIVEPPADVPKGWDLADAEGEGWTGQQVLAALKTGVSPEAFYTNSLPTKDNRKQIKVVNLEQLLAHEFPPRENILTPWLPSQGVVMVYAGRGIGKTFFSLSVGLAVSSGSQFLKYQAERKKAVLLIDGEMPGAVLQERVAAFVAAQDIPPGDFRFITPDMQQNGQTIDLSRTEDQEAIEPYLDGVGLIIVDNLSTVCRTGRENEGEGWLPVQGWALQQRAKGRSVLFIHHAGKGGNQRGTSRREDILDTVIVLRRPTQYTADMGAVFEIHFEKSRGIYGEDVEPIEASLITAEDGSLSWVYRSVDVSTYDKVVGLLKEGLSVTEIANELEINKSTASRHSKKAKVNGDWNG